MTAKFEVGDTPADLQVVLKPETEAEKILLSQFYANPDQKQLSMLGVFGENPDNIVVQPEYIVLSFIGKYARR